MVVVPAPSVVAGRMVTLIPCSSSWIVEDGWARPIGETKRTKRAYTCSACDEPGHKASTCGMTDLQRKQRRTAQKRGIPWP